VILCHLLPMRPGHLVLLLVLPYHHLLWHFCRMLLWAMILLQLFMIDQKEVVLNGHVLLYYCRDAEHPTTHQSTNRNTEEKQEQNKNQTIHLNE
jgi:hypothetical protein